MASPKKNLSIGRAKFGIRVWVRRRIRIRDTPLQQNSLRQFLPIGKIPRAYLSRPLFSAVVALTWPLSFINLAIGNTEYSLAPQWPLKPPPPPPALSASHGAIPW